MQQSHVCTNVLCSSPSLSAQAWCANETDKMQYSNVTEVVWEYKALLFFICCRFALGPQLSSLGVKQKDVYIILLICRSIYVFFTDFL